MQSHQNHKLSQFLRENQETDNNKFGEEQQQNKHISNLYKEDSISSDKPLAIQLSKKQYHLENNCPEDHEQLQIKKFMKKAERLNQISYKRLNSQKPQVPEGKSLNIYKSNKNMLDDLGFISQKERHIKQIYLEKQFSHKKNYHSHKKTTKLSFHRRKLTTDNKFVQTQFCVEQNTQVKKQMLLGTLDPFQKSKLRFGSIEEDNDEQGIPIKRKANQKLNKINNTISFPNAERNGHKPDATSYLKNINKIEHNFNSSIKKYSFKSQFPQQSTRYSDMESVPPKTNFLQTLQQQQKFNPWSNSFFKDQKYENTAQNFNNQVISEKQQKIISSNGRKEQKSSGSHNKLFRNINNQHTTTENSISLQNSNAGKKYENNKSNIVKQKNQYYSTKQIQSKNINQLKKDQKIVVSKVDSFAQAPDYKQISIGTDTNNFRLPLNKKPIHPINIGFNQSDAGWITSQYKPKSQFLKKVDMSSFSIKKYRNGVYFGELNSDSLKNGLGVIFYFNGRSYQGTFVNDMKEGKGVQYFPDGSLYSGEFSKGLKQGKGSFEWPNGQVYDGQWKGGKKNGSGMWKSANGDSYLGQWKNGKIEGFGVLTVKDGDRYEGQFKNSMKNGLGTERYSSGDTYVGQFSKNRPNGQGQYFHHNGDIYKGMFSNGLKHGNGLLKTHKDEIYQGEFRNDKKCGNGQLTQSTGVIYNGNFENDLKHGYGEEKCVNNQIKKGYWINGQMFTNQIGAIVQEQLDKLSQVKQVNTKKAGKTSKLKKNGKVQSTLKKRQNQQRKTSLSKSPLNKSPLRNRQNSLQKQDNPNFHRTCGCSRKH